MDCFWMTDKTAPVCRPGPSFTTPHTWNMSTATLTLLGVNVKDAGLYVCKITAMQRNTDATPCKLDLGYSGKIRLISNFIFLVDLTLVRVRIYTQYICNPYSNVILIDVFIYKAFKFYPVLE